jgi:carbonic anhydrase
MDARIELFDLLGLEWGDAHLIRNAGGLVTDDALRSLSASQRLLGTEEIIVVMHRDCGLHGASDDEFADRLEADGARADWRLGGFDDLEATLRAGLARLRSEPALISRDRVRGLIYDPADGSLEEIDAS